MKSTRPRWFHGELYQASKLQRASMLYKLFQRWHSTTKIKPCRNINLWRKMNSQKEWEGILCEEGNPGAQNLRTKEECSKKGDFHGKCCIKIMHVAYVVSWSSGDWESQLLTPSNSLSGKARREAWWGSSDEESGEEVLKCSNLSRCVLEKEGTIWC